MATVLECTKMTKRRRRHARAWAFRLALVLLVLLVSGCAPLPLSPARANEDWLRLETDHFELSTNLPPERAARAAEALERTRVALLATAWNRPADAGRITSRTAVVVLRDQADFEHYSHRRIAGFFSPLPRPTIFLYGSPETWEQQVIARGEAKTSVLIHEVTHQLVAGFFVRVPRWFTEGLAQFLETMQISGDGKTATIGGVNLAAFLQYRSALQASSVGDALAWSSDADADARTTAGRYGVSWLLVHFLFNTQPVALSKFQTKLAAGVDPELAWSRTFPGVAPAMFDQQIDDYWRHGVTTKLTRPVPSVTVAPVKRVVTAADVLAIRAQIALDLGESNTDRELVTEGVRGIEQALALEPGNALALRLLRLRASVPPATVRKWLHTQVERRPDDGDAWLLLGDTLEDGTAEREAAYRRAVLLMPRSAEAYNALAWELATTKRGEAALPLASKAALLAPWNAEIIDTYAATLFAVGRCPDALSTQRRALDLVPEKVATAAMTRAMTTRLEEYERACGHVPDEHRND